MKCCIINASTYLPNNLCIWWCLLFHFGCMVYEHLLFNHTLALSKTDLHWPWNGISQLRLMVVHTTIPVNVNTLNKAREVQ
jgi:hypothetical protein